MNAYTRLHSFTPLILLTPLTPLTPSAQCVYLVHLVHFVHLVHLVHLVCVMLCVSCVYLVRLCMPVYVSSVPVYAAHITPLRLHSFTPLYMLNPLTPLSVSSCSSYSFDPLNYLSGSIHSKFSKRSTLITTRIIRAFRLVRFVYLLEHCNALKSISLSEEESPRGSKCLTRFNLFGMFGEYGVFKGVRRVRGKHSYNP